MAVLVEKCLLFLPWRKYRVNYNPGKKEGVVDRRAAVAAYKERKSVCGIYALRCGTSGEVWVGYAADMEKIRNRIEFTLRSGASPHRSLLEACRKHGVEAFSVEELEVRGEEDEPGFAREAWRKARVAYWRDKLGAEAM
jgi:hypothetical protein